MSRSCSLLVLMCLTTIVVSTSTPDPKHLRTPLIDYPPQHHSSVTSSTSSGGSGGVFSMIFGLMLFCFGFPCLWYNERRYLVTQYRIEHAFEQCKTVNSAEVDPSAEGQLVYTSGMARTTDIITDAQFAVTQANAIKLKRHVEMLQWQETSQQNDNYTTYEYNLGWHSMKIDSGTFNQQAGHYNDLSKWVVEHQTFIAPNVYLGQYFLSESLKKQTSNYVSVLLNQSNADVARRNYQQSHQNISIAGKYVMLKQTQYQEMAGDVRVSFDQVPCEDLTVVSQQTQNTFTPYAIHDKYEEKGQSGEQLGESVSCCCCMCDCAKALESPMSEIDWIYESIMTKTQAFNEQLNSNKVLTLLLRFGGWFLMGIGLCMFFSPITYIISLFPLLGHFLASITGFIFGLISFLIATPCALIAMAVAWLYYRPAVGLGLIAIAAAITGLIYFIVHQHQN